MVTKYILAGGLDRAHQEYWDRLGEEIDTKKPVHLLSCFFSQPKKNWRDKFREFEPYFKRAFGDDVICELADVENFLNQIKKCDVIYLHGGTTHRLKSVLARYDNIKLNFAGKVVIGSSAGANYLSKLCWSPSLREVMKGSGIVPITVLVHYGSSFVDDDTLGPVDWKEAKRQLQELVGSEGEVTLLREGKFVVVNENN